MDYIVSMVFGSHLYGTNTPESDKDYKGVFMPTKEEIFLGKIPKCYHENTGNDFSKNTKDDTDMETYSLHQFIKLACEGQTVAIDMLFAPEDMITTKSPTWDNIVKERNRFITRDMSAFIGYCQRQAAKYGIKGSRLSAAKSVLDFINKEYTETYKVSEFWDDLPRGEHIRQYTDDLGMPIYEVCGKKIQATAKMEYLYSVIEKFYNSYGARAKQAEKNLGIDWKAISHAIRVCEELKELYTTGTIVFPLKSAHWIKDIKQGKRDYNTDVAPLLESLVAEVKGLSEKSEYPKKVDRAFWDNFLYNEIKNRVDRG